MSLLSRDFISERRYLSAYFSFHFSLANITHKPNKKQMQFTTVLLYNIDLHLVKALSRRTVIKNLLLKAYSYLLHAPRQRYQSREFALLFGSHRQSLRHWDPIMGGPAQRWLTNFGPWSPAPAKSLADVGDVLELSPPRISSLWGIFEQCMPTYLVQSQPTSFSRTYSVPTQWHANTATFKNYMSTAPTREHNIANQVKPVS